MSDRDQDTSEQQVRAVLEDYTEALRQKDAKRALAHHDPAIVQFLLAPPLRCANDSAVGEKALQAWFDSFIGSVLGFEVRDLELVVDGDLACCHHLTRMSGAHPDSAPTNLWLRETMILRRRDGAWKIWHVHESVPFYMDGSERAATDLKP